MNGSSYKNINKKKEINTIEERNLHMQSNFNQCTYKLDNKIFLQLWSDDIIHVANSFLPFW